MGKILINSQIVNEIGWQSIIYLTGKYSMPLVFYWPPTLSRSDFKYPQINYFLACYTQYNLPGVVENEQSRNQKPKLELGVGLDCVLHIRTRDLSWGVA